MVLRLNTSIPMLKLYIQLDIWRCDGPGKLEMLTVINALWLLWNITSLSEFALI